MTDTPIIRAARALWEMSDRPLKLADTSPSMAIPESEPDLERFIPQVRAVLEAIREPSEAMLKPDSLFSHFYHDADGIEDNAYFEPDEAKRCWQAMIDAALSEQS